MLYAKLGLLEKVDINTSTPALGALLIAHFKIWLEVLQFETNNKHNINNN